MADPAVQIHGSERPVDVLSAAARRLLVPAAALLLATLAGCTADAPPAGQGADADGAALDGALGEAFAALLAEGDAVTPPPPRWPDDLDFHPDARAESIELIALLRDAEGRPYSFDRRLERLTLRRGARRGGAGQAGFAFDDVVRLAGATLVGPDPRTAAGGGDRAVMTSFGDPPALERLGDDADAAPAGGVVAVRAALERVTLGLAEVDARRLTLRDARTLLEPGAAGGAAAGGGDCAIERRYAEGDGLELRFRQTRCPQAQLLGSLVLATSPTLAVDGVLAVDGERRAVEGRGWVRRAWGEPPAPGGAVVFDRLLLALDGVGLLEASRSKRRSGRGPSTVTARLAGSEAGSGAGSGAARSVTLEWLDTGETALAAAGGTGRAASARAAGWRLRSAELGLDLAIVPPAGGAWQDDALGRRWRGAVLARGSHEGVGFIEIAPVAPGTRDEET